MIEVLSCAPLTTVQDSGRHGLRHLGICQAGAVDSIALHQVNLLLGNPPDAAALEVTFGPVQLKFHDERAVALSGADFSALLLKDENDPEGTRLLPGYRHSVPAGAVIRLGKPAANGQRAYLGVEGGIRVPLVLGSRSTDLGNRFGGLEGRALQAGDRLETGKRLRSGGTSSQGIRPLAPNGLLRAIPGPEYEHFTAQSRADIWQEAWQVTGESNRMGLRLTGGKLRLKQDRDMASSAVLPGVIQVPGNGQPIILGADAQTTGGYPRIATVIRADLWQLAYLSPGTTLYLQEVSVEEAQQAGKDNDHYLDRLSYNLRCATAEEPEDGEENQHAD